MRRRTTVAVGLVLAGLVLAGCAKGRVRVDATAPITNPDSDADGDGFTNAEEWRYVQYYANEPDAQRAAYRDAIATNAKPAISHDCYLALDRASVAVVVLGNGRVYLGDRDICTTGKWEFAKWTMDCATPCTGTSQAKPECDYNRITVTARPDAGYVLKGWLGDLTGSSALEHTLTMDRDWYIQPEFVACPWTGELDLIGALERFLLKTKQITSADEVLTFDRGAGHYDNQTGKSVYVYDANGIPDAAEFLLLQELLLHRDYGAENGVWAFLVWDEFSSQRAFIKPYLKGNNEKMNLAATAYLTIGGLDYLFWMREALGFDIDYRKYGNLVGDHLWPDEDADGDGLSNLEEWQWVLERHDHPRMSIPLFQAFVTAALDPEVPPPAAPSAAASPDKAKAEDAAEGDDNGEGHLWNDAAIPKFRLRFNAEDALMDAFVIDPVTQKETPLALNTDLSIHAGRRIKVVYTGDPAWFDSWSAEGTLLHGSDNVKDVFVHVNDGQVIYPKLKDAQ